MSSRDFLNYSAFLTVKGTAAKGDSCVFLGLVRLRGIVRWLMILLFHDAPFTYYCENPLIHDRSARSCYASALPDEVAQIEVNLF